jgi:hypothetical protein
MYKIFLAQIVMKFKIAGQQIRYIMKWELKLISFIEHTVLFIV